MNVIDSEGLQHFCIYGYNVLPLLIEKYKPNIEESLSPKINWNHNSEPNNNFIFIKNNNGWNYLIWNNFDIHETIIFLKDISNMLSAKINYYFVDGCIDAARWIFSDKGEIIEGFCYQMGEIQYNLNYNQSEVESIISEAYSKFWDIYEKSTQPLHCVNQIEKDNIQIFYGQFKL